jgi:hypothetical protein
MAYTPINSSRYQVGKSTRKELFQDLVNNEDDLNTRVGDLEGAAAKIIVFEGDVINVNTASSLTGIAMFTASNNFNLTSAEVGVYDLPAGITGTLEIDIRKSTTRDFTTDVSVFTTRPSINLSAASDYEDSTNAVFDAGESDITSGEALKLNITSLGSEVLKRIYIKVYGTPS